MRSLTSLTRLQAAALLLALIANSATLFAEGVKKRIRFPRGSTSTVIEGAVIRGEMDRYILGAKAGQQMSVRITSLEDNAAFHIYVPGFKKTLDGAGETDDATLWTGKLPASGDYMIVVGGTRGNASYRLEVTIKP
jgi:hypothetical protein